MKSPMQIFREMQQFETKEEMVAYLRALPREDEPWPEEAPDQLAECNSKECEPPYGGKENCEFYRDGLCAALEV